MFKKTGNRKTWWISCGVVVGGIIILGVLAVIYWLMPTSGPIPSIRILQPPQAMTITSGQGVLLVVEGKSKSGIQRIGFYVNDVFHSQQAVSQGAQETFQAAFPWFSSQTGIQKLSVIAYDAQVRASEQASLLVAVKAVEVPHLGYRGVDDQIGNGESGNTGSQQGEESASGGQNQSESINENNQHLDDTQIAELLNQVDEAGNFPQELPGEPRDAPPVAFIFASTARMGERLNVTGSAQADDDFGLDYLAVEIIENGILNETQKEACFGELHCSWEYDFSLNVGETRTVIFTAYDTSGQASETRKEEYQNVGGEGDNPPAFVISEDFDPNEIQVVNNELEQRENEVSGDDFGTPRVAEYRCNYHDVKLEIPYKYVSDHGRNAYATAFVMNDGQLLASGGAPLEQGTEGTVRIQMERTTDVPLETSQIQLELKTVNPGNANDPYSGETFYSETGELSVYWGSPLPDLAITNVDRTVGGETISVDVRNNGCAPVERFSAIINTPPGADNWRGSFDRAIQPGASERFQIGGLDSNLYTREFEVVLDPDNTIQETVESNNSFFKPPITLKYVHIYQAVINWTYDSGELLENSDDGEFYLNVNVGNQSVRSPLRGEWSWVKGYHDIGVVGNPNGSPIILSPRLNWNDDLVVKIVMKEVDTVGSDQRVCSYEGIHSHDIRQNGSWKSVTRGEFVVECADFNLLYYKFVWDE